MILITTIIPVYNTAPYLSRCINSILAQGLRNDELEIILVDDGSTDGSEIICDDFVAKHPSIIRAVHKPNGGVSSARNVGIGLAKGEYIHFMDADDYMVPGGYAFLRDNFLNMNRDVDYLGFYSITLDAIAKKTFVESGNPYGCIVFQGTANEYYNQDKYFSLIFVGLYRRLFVCDIRFDVDYWIGEDIKFNLDFAAKNPNIVLTNCSLYRYDIRDGSAIGNRNPDRMRKAVYGYESILELAMSAKEQHPEMSRGLNTLIHCEMVPFMSRVLSSDLTMCEFRELKKRLIDNRIIPLQSVFKYDSYVNAIFSMPYLFPLLNFAYRKIFLPFILPKISKG